MTEHVPNEVLEVILGYAVTIPANTFESWSTPATFAGGPRSTISNILTVSKRWHDLAEPALYEAAILRTKAQVHSLALSAHRANDRGVRRATYLRRLRIEGGYCNSLNRLLGAAPAIDTLFLGFDISLNDSFAGLRRALQRINPSRLFLQSTPGGHATAQNTQSLYAAVGGAFPRWTNLKRIDTSPQFGFWSPMVPPLKELPALEVVSMTTHTATHNIQHITLNYIIENPSVRVIQIRDGVKWLSWKQYILDYPREKFVLGEGKNMTSWMEFPIPDALDPAPLARTPDLPDQVWCRILGFATHEHGYNFLEVDDDLVWLSETAQVNTIRWHIMLVNKRFHRLGLPYLYSIPHLYRFSAWEGLRTRVESSPELARLVRVLYLGMTLASPEPLHISAPLVNLVRAMDIRINVLLGIDHHLPDGAISLLERAVQSMPKGVAVTPRTFLKFPHLRHLTIHGGLGEELDDVQPSALPQLEYLALSDSGPGMLRLFCSMGLPRLRELAFNADSAAEAVPLLEVHGGKLDVLTLLGLPADDLDSVTPALLDLCLHITELHLHAPGIPKAIPFIAQCTQLAGLERVVCPLFEIGVPGRHEEEGKHWSAFIDFLKEHRHRMPALEEFRIFDLKWPMHEYTYKVSCFTQMALDLHELDIALADKDGTRWTRFDPLRFALWWRG